jgi:hypothetical protein
VTLNIHKLKQTKPLHDSQSITKIFRLLPEMGAIQHMHVTHPLGHRAIDVFINAFLSNTPEMSVSNIFSSLRILIRLREKFLLCSSYLPLGVPNWMVKLHQHHAASRTFSGAVAEEKEDFCKGSFARTSFTLF